MGNRAIITLESAEGLIHPVATYVHWNGGLESVLAFVTFTWETFPADVTTFSRSTPGSVRSLATPSRTG